jgi:hypothetical protein
MQIPLQINFCGMDHAGAAAQNFRERATKINKQPWSISSANITGLNDPKRFPYPNVDFQAGCG